MTKTTAARRRWLSGHSCFPFSFVSRFPLPEILRRLLMVSWSLWPAAAFPSSSRSRSRCLPLKLAEPAVAAAVRSQWLLSSSSQRASGGCCPLLASSMSTVAAISSLSPSHENLVLQDLFRIERLQARGNQQVEKDMDGLDPSRKADFLFISETNAIDSGGAA
uniref:Uncharacterized protein n=1 Tax=Oryza rufipogon TaxID=4529 RepID=A0A0E0QVK4_ORYRU